MTFARGNFKTGIDSLRGAKWRNFWTMLGVIIGVSSVITVVSIGEGIKLQVGGQIKHLSKDLITIRPGQVRSETGSKSFGQLSTGSITGTLTAADVASITQVSGVQTVVPLSATSGTVKADSLYNGGLIIGTTADFPNLLNQTLAYGSFLTSEDVGLHSAVLGKHAADMLFSDGIPLGHTFSYHGNDFLVKGIFNDFNTAPLSEQANFNNAIFIPYDIAQTLSNNTVPTFEILARTNNPKDNSSVTAKIASVIATNHGGAHDVTVLQQGQSLANSNYILELLTRLITGVAAISLLVGGIGIMNVMLVSVTERLHEIGIRKAIGATNRQILSQFVVEATVLSLGGAIIGIGLAYLVDGVLRLTTSLQPSIPWEIVVIATGVSLLVGIVFGTIPALKAARKDPIEALRSIS